MYKKKCKNTKNFKNIIRYNYSACFEQNYTNNNCRLKYSAQINFEKRPETGQKSIVF